MKSLPTDNQPEGRDSGDRESDPWEGAQRGTSLSDRRVRGDARRGITV